MPLVRDEPIAWRDAVVTEFLGLGHIDYCMKTLRCGALKYGYNLTYQDELYDLENDPHEMCNTATDPAYRAIRSAARSARRLDGGNVRPRAAHVLAGTGAG